MVEANLINREPAVNAGFCYSTKVTTFYDSNEKKLFKFGMAYENVQKLEKTVANNRKSIKNMKK